MADRLSDQEVQELIQIVGDGIKERVGHWYTLGIPINHYYNLDEKLDAIRRMGESRNIQALNYLTEISHCETGGEGWRDSGAVHDHTIYQYPKAPRSLQHILEYEEWTGFDYRAGSAQPVTKGLHSQRSRVMSALSEALDCLKKETS